MHLQRADTGGDIDDPGQRQRLKLEHQRMDAQPQFEIEHDRAVFDQQVPVALAAIADLRAHAAAAGIAVEHRAAERAVRRSER